MSRLIVNMVGDAVHGRLAESRFVPARFVYGGERSLYALAFAAASAGHEAELRGWLHAETFDRFRESAGVAPGTGLSARRPEPEDLVVVPEGWTDPVEYLQLSLSPARLLIYLLAPPGLFGWPFDAGGWTRPDPLRVPLDAVARPEHFDGMRALGFQLITNAPAMASAADARYIGNGQPYAPPDAPREKPLDVVAFARNRWAPLAAEVLGELGDVKSHLIGEAPHEEVLAVLASARTLVWPSRIEGHARITQEARSVGCVPVALDSNRFAVGLDEEHGAVTVPAVPYLAPAVRALLNDEGRWERLSHRARATAPDEVDWEAFVGRVDEVARDGVVDPGRSARAGAGAAARAALERERSGRQAQLEALSAELSTAKRDLDQATRQQEEYLVHMNNLRDDRDRIVNDLDRLRNRRAVRIALSAVEVPRRLGRRGRD